jgi:hypothetical protein
MTADRLIPLYQPGPDQRFSKEYTKDGRLESWFVVWSAGLVSGQGPSGLFIQKPSDVVGRFTTLVPGFVHEHKNRQTVCWEAEVILPENHQNGQGYRPAEPRPKPEPGSPAALTSIKTSFSKTIKHIYMAATCLTQPLRTAILILWL